MDETTIRMAAIRNGSPFLNTAQAAHFIGISVRTLERMRRPGTGPSFRYHGRLVRYHIDDLIAWSRGRAHRAIRGDALTAAS